jgi:hypothetical protein
MKSGETGPPGLDSNRQLEQPPTAVLFIIIVTFPLSVPVLAVLYCNFHKMSWRIRENGCVRTFYNTFAYLLVKLNLKTADEVNNERGRTAIGIQNDST